MQTADNKKIRDQKAFTLLEVMVALSVLAIGMMTLIKVSTQNTVQTAYLKDKTLAQWVAVNRVNEVKLAGWPNTGRTRGTETMANEEWEWALSVTNTPDKETRKLDIEVRQIDAEGEPLIRFSAYVWSGR